MNCKPDNWRVLRANWVLQLSMRRNTDGRRDELLSLSVTKGIHPKEYSDASQIRTGEELSKYFLVEPDQFVVNPMWLMHGSLGASRVCGVISPDYRVYDVREDVNTRYLHYLLKTQEYQDLYNLLARGTTTYDRRISKDGFNDLPILVPPLHTQKAIANFLDRKTAAIDALIEKKEKLLELLAEKRSALINQAVTKGLDPNVPMKDSGIPWIGEIPEHWELHQLKRVVKQFVDYRGRTPEKCDEGRPLITAGAVRDGRIDHSRAPDFVSEEVYRHLRQRGIPEKGDVLFTSEAPLGEVGLVEEPQFACAQRIILFKVDLDRMNPEFLVNHFLAPSGQGELWSRSSGSTAGGIRSDRLKMSIVPTPPFAEQRAIVSHIKSEIADFDTIARKIQGQTAKLREYRQSLITAAVTGQLQIPAEDYE
jgi:type I restriction enzyme, S subunit